MIRGISKSAPFRQQIAKPRGAPPPPESISWWWHPGRPGVPSGPPSWDAKLQEIDPDLRVTDDRYNSKWCIWMKKPQMQHKLCWGWSLLLAVDKATPIELILARLYEASARKWGGAKQYFDALEREATRAQERAEKQSLQDSIDQSMEVFNYSQIKNIGRGSKFSTYHQ